MRLGKTTPYDGAADETLNLRNHHPVNWHSRYAISNASLYGLGSFEINMDLDHIANG
jgi:hypothetical protein